MDYLPRTVEGAAANMADDLLLLEAYPEPTSARFRTYGWSEPAFTFGVSQRWAEWQPQLPVGCVLVRRPTGGGLVSHLADWTFSLALPAAHRVCGLEALESYAIVLRALESALRSQGQDVRSFPRPLGQLPYKAPKVCGERAEPHDLVAGETGRKLAGAAQKRTRDGLLLQGYVDRDVLPTCDWSRLERDFPSALAEALGEAARLVPHPAYASDLKREITARFASADWNERL